MTYYRHNSIDYIDYSLLLLSLLVINDIILISFIAIMKFKRDFHAGLEIDRKIFNIRVELVGSVAGRCRHRYRLFSNQVSPILFQTLILHSMLQ